jgi:hypothetical protein
VIEKATSISGHIPPAKLMQDALALLNAGKVSAAAAKMELAEQALAANAGQLFMVITMLHGLPGIEVTNASPDELVRLVDVLALASDHKELFRNTQVAKTETMAGLATKQNKLVDRCKPFIEVEEPHPMLVAAHQHLSTAASALQSTNRDKIRSSQKAADEQLRHFIVEQALILETMAVSGGGEASPDDPGGTGSDSEHAMTASFVSGFVSGESPKDKRTEWQVLGDRNRAALNQNFARELPLEYRGLLKNYYERVAK